MACLYIPKFATLVQVINDLNITLKMKTLRKMLLQIGKMFPTQQAHQAKPQGTQCHFAHLWS